MHVLQKLLYCWNLLGELLIRGNAKSTGGAISYVRTAKATYSIVKTYWVSYVRTAKATAVLLKPTGWAAQESAAIATTTVLFNVLGKLSHNLCIVLSYYSRWATCYNILMSRQILGALLTQRTISTSGTYFFKLFLPLCCLTCWVSYYRTCVLFNLLCRWVTCYNVELLRHILGEILTQPTINTLVHTVKPLSECLPASFFFSSRGAEVAGVFGTIYPFFFDTINSIQY